FFSSRRRHTRWPRDWSSDVCSSDLNTTSAPTAANIANHPILRGLESYQSDMSYPRSLPPHVVELAIHGPPFYVIETHRLSPEKNSPAKHYYWLLPFVCVAGD